MTRITHVLLAAATAIAVATPAGAATFTRIELATSGSGSNIFGGVQTILRDLTFTYVVPTDGDPALLSSAPDSLTFAGDPFLLYPAFTRLTATNTEFRIAQGDQASGLTATACYTAPTSAILPTAGFSTDPSCSPVTYNTISHRSETRYTGRVTDVRVSRFDQDAAQLGLVSVASAVPEPTTWVLLLAGFGMTGYQLRRRRSRSILA